MARVTKMKIKRKSQTVVPILFGFIKPSLI